MVVIKIKCTNCNRMQRCDLTNIKIFYYRQGIQLFQFGIVKCLHCGKETNIGGVQISPSPIGKRYDDNPLDQREGETEGQWADRMYFDENGNQR